MNASIGVVVGIGGRPTGRGPFGVDVTRIVCDDYVSGRRGTSCSYRAVYSLHHAGIGR